MERGTERGTGGGALDAGPAGGAERRCLVTRQRLPRERMVRFVVGPGAAVVPDIAERLPGRGLWVEARRDTLDRAAGVFARAARRRVAVPEALSDQVERLLAARCTDLIGLARRAGQALSGFDSVARALAAGRAALVVVAADGSPRERDRLTGAGRAAPVVDVLDSAELGGVFGRARVVYAAFRDCRLAWRFRAEAGRLAGFRCG